MAASDGRAAEPNLSGPAQPEAASSSSSVAAPSKDGTHEAHTSGEESTVTSGRNPVGDSTIVTTSESKEREGSAHNAGDPSPRGNGVHAGHSDRTRSQGGDDDIVPHEDAISDLSGTAEEAHDGSATVPSPSNAGRPTDAEAVAGTAGSASKQELECEEKLEGSSTVLHEEGPVPEAGLAGSTGSRGTPRASQASVSGAKARRSIAELLENDAALAEMLDAVALPPFADAVDFVADLRLADTRHAFEAILAGGKATQTVEMGNPKLRNPDCWRFLGSVLANCSRYAVKQLFLQGNDADSTAASCVAAGLLHCEGLEAIYLSGNAIGDDGMANFVTTLHHLPNFKRLVVSDCGIGDDGAIVLADLIANHDAIEEVVLGDNGDITGLGIAAIGRAVFKNSGSIKSITGVALPITVQERLALNIVDIRPESMRSKLLCLRDERLARQGVSEAEQQAEAYEAKKMDDIERLAAMN